ncbi:MAG: LptF/LptG family permease [Ignavibacteriales bacterium]|nr:LptF/LptG family permease [Ignavibacteriales bacterium]
MVFILIGAPLGVMVRKGGFGVAASISLLFFLIYWAFLIGGEKLAERGFFSPFIGMWAANFCAWLPWNYAYNQNKPGNCYNHI